MDKIDYAYLVWHQIRNGVPLETRDEGQVLKALKEDGYIDEDNGWIWENLDELEV